MALGLSFNPALPPSWARPLGVDTQEEASSALLIPKPRNHSARPKGIVPSFLTLNNGYLGASPHWAFQLCG